jgi:D-alanyl-D-alanine carboxypeptidase
MAVAVAEQIGGSEESFAEMMTRKARSLGMNDTTFVNASGLPDDDQITTAYDLAILARAIQERFPRYYPLFATRSFYYSGRAMRNHNHLLDRVEGMDGIKTGYTRSSGFNLMTNVRRDGRQIVAVVLGGSSAAGRDRIMANLIEDHLREAALGDHMAPVLADASPRAKPAVVAEASAPARPPARPLTLGSAGEGDDQRLPGNVQAYASTTTPSAPRWSVASKLIEAAAERQEQPSGNADAAAPASGKVFTDRLPPRPPGLVAPGLVAEAAPLPPARAEAPKTMLARLDPPKAAPAQEPAKKADSGKADGGKADSGKTVAAHLPDDAPTASIGSRPKVSPRLGWMIQLGATPEETKAAALIERAKTSGTTVLSKAESFTEKVTKDGTVLFRARFAGFDEDAAQTACKVLKKNGFACFATRS